MLLQISCYLNQQSYRHLLHHFKLLPSIKKKKKPILNYQVCNLKTTWRWTPIGKALCCIHFVILQDPVYQLTWNLNKPWREIGGFQEGPLSSLRMWYLFCNFPHSKVLGFMVQKSDFVRIVRKVYLLSHLRWIRLIRDECTKLGCLSVHPLYYSNHGSRQPGQQD